MTVAVVFATTPALDGGPAAALPWPGEQDRGASTLLARLLGQLSTLAVHRVHLVTRPEWDAALEPALDGAPLPVRRHVSASPADDLRLMAQLAGSTRAPLVVLHGDIVTHREALAGLLADPRVVTGILSGRARRRGVWRTRSARGRVVSAGSAYHFVRRGNGSFLDVLKVGPRDRDVLVAAADRLAALLTPEAIPAWEEALDRKALRWARRLAEAPAEGEERGAPAPAGRASHEERMEAAADENALDGEEPRPDGPDETDEPGEPGAGAARPAGRAGLRQREHAWDTGELFESNEPVWLTEAEIAQVEHQMTVARQDVVSLLLVGLVREGVHVTNSYLRQLFWTRPLSREAVSRAAERIGHYDEDRVLLHSAVKANDGFFTTYFVSPYSKYLARWAARRGWSPNLVTTISMAIGVLAAAAFATGSRAGLVAGAILLQVAFTADCVDGQLARYTRTFSKLGAWLDSVFDRGKEYAVFAGLAIGSTRGFGDDVWMLAGAALTLQTVRHYVDFSYAASQHQAMSSGPRLPLEQPSDRVASSAAASPGAAGVGPAPLPTSPAGGSGQESAAMRPAPSPLLVAEVEPAAAAPERDAAVAETPHVPLARRAVTAVGREAIAVSRALERRPWTRWAKKILVLPIGERFALISLGAALTTPRITFVLLLAWGALASAYTVAGRVLRSVAR